MAPSFPILVVSSQAAGIRGVRTALKQAGAASARIHVAAPDLLPDLLRGQPFELAIVEDGPGLDARKLVVKIRRWAPLLPVIVVASSPDAKRLSALRQAGASDALARSRLKAELPAAVKRARTERAGTAKGYGQNGQWLGAPLANAPAVIWALDTQGIFTLHAGKGLEAMGLDAGAYLGQSIYELYPDREDILDPIRRALKGEECVRIIDNRGNVTETRYAPQREAGGKITGMIGVSMVITGRYRAEQALREAQKQLTHEIELRTEELQGANWELQAANEELRSANEQLAEEIRLRNQANEVLAEQATLLDLAHDAVIVCDFDDRIRYWNRGAERLYGFDRHEAVGRIAYEMLQTRFPDSFAAIKVALERDGVFEGQLEQITADGRCILVHSRWAVQPDWRGEGAVYLQINRDITARTQAEEALRHSEERYRLLFNTLSSGFALHEIICDDHGTPCDYRFLEVNAAFEGDDRTDPNGSHWPDGERKRCRESNRFGSRPMAGWH